MSTSSTNSLFSQNEDTETEVTIHPDTDLNKLFLQTNMSETVSGLLAMQDKLRERIASQIHFAKPILTHGGFPVLFPNTIMVIQGQSGVHKSRVAECICSAFLANGPQENQLGFTTNTGNGYHLLYADTERNLSDQYRYALQQIVIKAGYSTSSLPDNFSFISLMDIDRKQRFDALHEIADYYREKTYNHLVIVLDVTTDCIADFNKPEETMRLIDLMNRLINNSNCSFICIIHENPNSEKARGHLGTEIMNKASTVLQVGFVKKDNKATELIELKFMKMRSTKKPDSIFCKYSEDYKGLILADSDVIAAVAGKGQQQSAAEEIIIHLETYFKDKVELENKELMELLCSDFQSKGDAMRKRVNKVIQEKLPINIGPNDYRLVKLTSGRNVVYKIIPLQENSDEDSILE